jgi:tetratricopeptide (TPR) repeat protein
MVVFRGKHNDFSGGVFKEISFKYKIAIFCVLSIIVVIIASKSAMDNGVNNKSIIEKIGNSNSNSNSQTFIKASDQEEDKGKVLNNSQKEENEKIEDKYQQSVKSYSHKNYSDTISIANEIINEDPSFYEAYNIKGIALCYSGNYEEGMKNIDKSLELKPNFGYARFNKALAYELHGDYDDALNWYDKDLEIENYIWSYYGKASIYGRRGDVQNTIKYLKYAIDISPDIKKLANEEVDFNPVKNSKEFQDLIK